MASTPAVRVARAAIVDRATMASTSTSTSTTRAARARRGTTARAARDRRATTHPHDDHHRARESAHAHAREKREDERATLVARSMARDDERAVGAVRWARARSRKGRWRLDEDGIAGRARLLGERSSGRGRTTEPRASGGQFAPPGDVVTKSVETLDVDGEVMGDANVMEAMTATATARYAETLLRQNRSHAIESTFLDDFVDVTCDIDDAECAEKQYTKREELWRAWNKANDGVSKRTRGLVLFAFLMAGFGANITLIKIAQQEMSTDLFAALRFTAGSLVFAPFLKSALKDDRIVRGGFELGLWVSLGYYLQNIGVELTDAARASFISSFTIIAVPIIAGLSGRSVRSQTWIATAIAVAGLAMMEDLVSVPGLVDATTATAVADVVAGDAPASLRGDLYTLGSAFIFGVHIFRTDCIFNGVYLKHKESMGLVCIQMLTVVTVFFGLLARDYLNCDCDLGAILGVNSIAEIPWGLIGFVGVVTTAGCVYLETVALTLLASQEATLMYSTEPVWGALFAYMLLGETLSPSAAAGAGLILASTLVGSISSGGSGGGDEGAESPESPRADAR